MSDTTTTNPDPVTAPVAPSTTAPAVHGDRLWDGARKLLSLPDDAPLIETKQQYFDELNKRGFRMKDQQESTTGPEREITLPDDVPQPRPTPPLTRAQAEAICAASAVFLTHGIKQTFWCNNCFAIGRAHGCKSQITSRRVMVECRCGVQVYQPPMGATDLPTKLANTTHTELDKTTSILHMQHGDVTRPTVILQREEAKALIAYAQTLNALGLEGRWFCSRCWEHQSVAEEFSMGVKVAPTEIVFVCNCRMLFYRSTGH